MTDVRQRAIEDVARATNWSTNDVKLFILHAGTVSEDGSDKAFEYAVTQRELVLQMRDIITNGYVIVPREPTEAMLDAAWAEALGEDAAGVWREMINASPSYPLKPFLEE